MQNKIDFNYLYQGFTPANINLYQTGNFESSHLGDNAATLEMLSLQWEWANRDHSQESPEIVQPLLS